MLSFGKCLFMMNHLLKLILFANVVRHCDQVHAVEAMNQMKTDSSVLYIPSTPLCPRSSQYLYRQRAAFESGR